MLGARTARLFSALLALTASGKADATAAEGRDRLWILTDRRLVAADLETGAEIGSIDLAGGDRLLAAGRSGPLFVRIESGELLRIDRDGNAPRRVETSLDPVLAVVELPSGVRFLVSRDEIERSSPDGRSVALRPLPRVVSHVVSDGARVWGLGAGAAFRLGEAVAPASPGARREFDAADLTELGEPLAACHEPVDDRLVVVDGQRLTLFEADGRRVAAIALASSIGVACADFARAWSLDARGLALWRTSGPSLELERRVDLALDAPVVSLTVDPRDLGPILALAESVEGLDPEGGWRWTWRGDGEERIREVAVTRAPARPAPPARGARRPLETAASPSESAARLESGGEPLTVTGQVFVGETQPDSDPYAGEPLSGAEVIAFGDDLALTTAASDGSFELLTERRPTSPNLNVEIRKATPLGILETWSRSVTVPGGTPSYDLGAIGLGFPCGLSFTPGLFPSGALNGEVRAIALFDDGNGPALYVAGTFTSAGGVAANRVARWNGTGWSALGSGLGGGTSPSVDALAVFDDGSGPKLYAGGKFTTSGSTSVKYVGRWNGTAWSQVGAGLASQVLALAAFDAGNGPALYAGGTFTSANGTTYNRLARWTGSSWATVGGGANATVRAFAAFDDGVAAKLVVGGSFTQVGGSLSASRIAAWDGSAWSALGSGVSGGSTIQVNALAADNLDGTPTLYVGGRFTSAGGGTVNHVAAWNGTGWSPLGAGLGVLVSALGVHDDGLGPRLYAAGTFTTVGGDSYNRLARWSGNYWEPIGTGVNGAAKSLGSGDLGGVASLFVGGAFTSADGVAAGRLARIERLTTCADIDRPKLYWVDPLAGETLSTGTPLLRVGLVDRGASGLDSSTFEIRREGLPLALSCTYFDYWAECLPSEPLGSGAITLEAYIEDHAGNASLPTPVSFTLSESTPPTLEIVEPLEGATVTSARPALRFAYSDDGAGVDTATLAVAANGQPVGLECQLGPSSGVCVPVADFADVSVLLEATIRDLQGNESAPDSVSFLVESAQPATTTVIGIARFEDGSPASGARVWVADVASQWVTALADGSFTIPAVSVDAASRLSLSARVTLANLAYLGFAEGIEPVLDGVTDAGLLELKRRCDGYFETLPFTVDAGELNGVVYDLISWQSSDGPQVVAAGEVNFGSEGRFRQVVAWSDAGWQTLGGGVWSSSYQPDVEALEVFDEGGGELLVVGGKFTAAGGAEASHLAAWDGTSWRELGRGVNGRVTGLAVFDAGAGDELYVAGHFSAVGTRPNWSGTDVSIPAYHVAKWDGETWSEVGGGLELSGPATDLRLDVLDDGSGEHLFAWEHDGWEVWQLVGGSWTAIAPASISSPIESLVSADDGSGSTLFLAADGIRKRVGATWQQILEDWQGYSLAGIAEGPSKYLYAAGTFEDLGGAYGEIELRRWNGTTWSAALADQGDPLFVLPDPVLGDVLVTPSPFAHWSGTSWEEYSAAGDTVGGVTSIALLGEETTPSVLFAGPLRAGGVQLDGGIGRWDGTSVSTATAGLPGGTKVVQAHDGVRLRTYGIAEATGLVAEWNGSGWTPIGDPVGVPIRDLDWIDIGEGPRLYAAGDGLFRWNGAFWYSLGGPSWLRAVEGFQNNVYVAGGSSGSSGHFRRWDGTAWTALGSGSKPILALESFNGKLQIGGEFTSIGGGQSRYGFAAWTGTAFDRGEGPACGYLKNRYNPSHTQGACTTLRLA